LSTVFVTGASGFIGSHLCQRLVAEGHQVHGLSRIERCPQGDLIRWWQADLGDYETIRGILKRIRPQILFHLASRVTGSRELKEVVPIFQANLASTVNVLTSSVDSGCERIILAGSSEEPRQLNCATPCSPYAVAKWSGTAYASMFRALFGLPVVVPRIFMTYGPGQVDEQKLVPYTIRCMLKGDRPKLSSGARLIDWIFVKDVVEGLIKAAFVPGIEDFTFDLGSGSLTSIRAVVEQIAEIIGTGIQADFGALPDRAMETERVADIEFTERVLQWKPTKLLRDGLAETVDWYRCKAHDSNH
jgi:UDP-glucose 4-epimerase